MDKKELLMASQLVEAAKGRLVIRGLSDCVEGEFPHIGLRRRVSIYLLSFCRTPRAHHPRSRESHRGFFEVHYVSEDDPTRWHEVEEFEIRSVQPSGPVPIGVGPWTHAVWEWFQVWKQTTPPWVEPDDVVVCNKNQNGHFSLCSQSHLRFLLHFTRLHGLLLKYGATTPSSWETDDLIRRLGSFIKTCNRNWERVIG